MGHDVDGRQVDAIVQVGTNLAMACLAGIAELWLGGFGALSSRF